MSFGDDISEPAKPHRPTLVIVFRCRRCQETISEAHPDPLESVRRAVATGFALTLHSCTDGTGGTGIAEMIGTSGVAGVTLEAMLAARRAATEER